MKKEEKIQARMKRKKKIKKLGFWVKILSKGSLSLVEVLLISRIPNKELEQITKMTLDQLQKTIEVLSDDNEDNAKQVEKVWLDFIRNIQFVNQLKLIVSNGINNIKHEGTKNFLHAFDAPLIDTLQVVIDDNPQDGKQVAEIWKQFGSEKENINAIFKMFDKDGTLEPEVEAVVEVITETIASLFND